MLQPTILKNNYYQFIIIIYICTQISAIYGQNAGFTEIRLHKEGVEESFVKKDSTTFLYHQGACGFFPPDEEFKHYPDFFRFTDTALTCQKLEKISKKYAHLRKNWTSAESSELVTIGCGGCKKKFLFDLIALQDKEPTLKRVLDFIRAFRRERGCNNSYKLYKVQKGENLSTVAKKFGMVEEMLLRYNFENKVHFCDINPSAKKDAERLPPPDNQNCGYFLGEPGYFILVPCVLKKPKSPAKHKQSTVKRRK